ncbi:ferredoxin [Deltaproteobacteria bacterium]|nr:ferredoxin [Deltaproteobacteria bacterium]
MNLPGPRDDAYWSREALVAEEKRVFEVCNGCRLCFNLCPSFPALFDAVDALDTTSDPAPAAPLAVDALGNHAAATGGAHAAAPRADVLGQAHALERLPLSVHQKVVDLCYQCKLCDPICPYTPPHEFALDFPRLMLRHKAIDARENGVALQDRVLGNPDLIGQLGSLLPTVANFVTNLPLNRAMMEKTVGIHRDRQLPAFANQTFLSWFRARHAEQPAPEAVTGPKVVLFYTCSVQWNEPQVGRAAVEVLEHNGVTVFAPEMKCCGMPALDGGDVATATSWAKHNVDALLPYVEAGCEIVSPGPTCSFMLKKEWGEYIGSEAAERIGKASFDLMEYLFRLRKEQRLREDYTTDVGGVAYHLPCHLKVQKIGFRSRDMLKRLPGAKVTLVDQCSCMDGTWGMKKEFYQLSKDGSQKLMNGLKDSGAETYSSDCLIAKLQIEEQSGKTVKHPIELMWTAYGGRDDAPLAAMGPVEPPKGQP